MTHATSVPGAGTSYPVEVVDEVDIAAAETPLDTVAYKLYRKAVKYGTWDPAAIDLSGERAHYERLDESLRIYLERFCAAFHNAEQNVARVFCPWVMAAPTLWQQAFLSTQLLEEYKHTDFFERYCETVFGHRDYQAALCNPVHDSLAERGQALLAALETEDDREMRFVEAVTHYQGIIEGVQANTGYHIFLTVFARKGLMPGLSEGFRNIQRDEGRHVSFGLQTLRYYAHQDERYARRIREMYEDYLPLIRVRYGQAIAVDGKTYDPPPDEHGVEQLMALYHRRLHDIFA
jgi:ribonucleoside-diphosphate reductase beta chain